jgi:hypothetical protein
MREKWQIGNLQGAKQLKTPRQQPASASAPTTLTPQEAQLVGGLRGFTRMSQSHDGADQMAIRKMSKRAILYERDVEAPAHGQILALASAFGTGIS